MKILTQHALRILTVITVVCSALLLPKLAQPAQANPLWGYLWQLNFPFDNSFDGELILMVGPWQKGGLIEIVEKSSTTIPCQPVGNVTLQKGFANFDGSGYLQCQFDLAGALMNNHGFAANPLDHYIGVQIWAEAQIDTPGIAPLFSHPDANFWVTAPTPWQTIVNTDLNNNHDSMSAHFSATPWNVWQQYHSHYACPLGNACDITQRVGANAQTLVNQGDPAQFHTSATIITIGRLGTDNFIGRINSLQIDPGNHGHGG